MPLDPSVILGGQTKPVDPLAIAGQALAIKNELLKTQAGQIANTDAQQTLNARNALGAIYQQPGMVDPSTGMLVTNKLLPAVAANRDAAWMAPQVAKDQQGLEQSQVTIDTSKYELAKKHIQTLQQAMAPLIANPNSTPDDYIRAASGLVSQGLLKRDEAVQGLQGMPQDPQSLHAWGIGHYAQLLDTDKQLDVLYGKAQQTNTGAAIQQGTESAVTGYHPQGNFPLSLSPADASSPVQTVSAGGTPGVISKGQFAAQTGTGGGSGAYVPINGQPMDGSPPAPAQPMAAPKPQGNGFMATGLAPGQAEALQDSAGQGQAAIKASSDYRLNVRPLLDEVSGQLDQGVLTGPNAHSGKLLGQFASQLGIDVANTPHAEVADKVLEMLAQKNLAALSGAGVPTDAKLASSQNASPSTKLSNEGLRETLATVKGTGQAVDLLGQAYQHYLSTATNPIPFNQYKVQFAKEIDPYVLVLRSMPKADMAKTLAAMTPKERAQITQASATLDRLAQGIGWQP